MGVFFTLVKCTLQIPQCFAYEKTGHLKIVMPRLVQWCDIIWCMYIHMCVCVYVCADAIVKEGAAKVIRFIKGIV